MDCELFQRLESNDDWHYKPLYGFESRPTCIPEQRLFRAVLDQAIIDCGDTSDHIRLKATTWVDKAGIDFQEVCDLAGLNSQFVKRIIKAVVEKRDALRRARKESP